MSSQHRVRPSTSGFIIMVLLALAVYVVLSALPTGSAWFPSSEIAARANTSGFYKFLWFFSDMNEAQFYNNFLGGIFLIIGSAVAWFFLQSGSKLAGFTICYSDGAYPGILFTQTLGLILSVFVFNFTRFLTPETDWIPTFVPFVSIPPVLVLVYGFNLVKGITASVLGAALCFPLAYFSSKLIIAPLELPGVMSNVVPMFFGGLVAVEVCRHLPWMEPEETPVVEEAPGAQADVIDEQGGGSEEDLGSASWFIRRVLADFSEPQFYGNEVAGLFLIIGTTISYLMDPDSVTYGNQMFPAILSGQLLAVAIAIYLWHGQLVRWGSFPTFVPLASVTPTVVGALGGTFASVILGALLGAVLAPPFADLINKKLAPDFPPLIGNTFAMFAISPIALWIAQAILE
ncbi:MAG TPA: hypothetical protein VJ036_08090 [bacterium]|jgi:hypothetical protein|nr:hypothetical protein [bacterium]